MLEGIRGLSVLKCKFLHIQLREKIFSCLLAMFLKISIKNLVKRKFQCGLTLARSSFKLNKILTGGCGVRHPPILYPVGKSEGSRKIQGSFEKAISIRRCIIIRKN